jgi:hypothetical protein
MDIGDSFRANKSGLAVKLAKHLRLMPRLKFLQLKLETSRPPHSLDSRLTGGGELSALRAGSTPFSPWNILVPISVRGGIDPSAIMRLDEFGKLKNQVT